MTLHPDEYYIPSQPSIGEYREKGSKFFGYAYHVQTVEEVEAILLTLKKEHPKSRHLCYAYRFSPMSDQYRIQDDGEPSGTAGKPIFGQIQSFEFYECLIVVVRYFGGTKLGASGLIRAYKTAAKDALEKNTPHISFNSRRLILRFKYAIMGDLMNVIKRLDLKISEQIFDENPIILLDLHATDAEAIVIKIKATFLHRSISDIEEDTTIDGLTFELIE